MANSVISTLPINKRFRPTTWLILLAIFTLPAILSALLMHTRMLQLQRETILWKWLLDFSLGWYIWAALTPLIVWLGRKFLIERANWLKPAIIHFSCGLFFSIFQISLAVFFSILVYAEPMNWTYVSGQIVPTVFGRLLSQLTVYFVILGVSYAIDYQRQSNERALRESKLESELTAARLDALKQQLQPHFLFNTLNSISVLMQKGEISLANKVLGDLSDLLRQVLRKENTQLVTLEEELEFVRRYVAIEQVRYGERLQVTFEIPEDVLSSHVPSFVLQLLVENAIRHGVAKKADSGKVRITALRVGDRLQLQVVDDGVGIDGDQISEGVGISNARSRLQHLFGDNQRIEIHNNGNAGVTALIELPISDRAKEL